MTDANEADPERLRYMAGIGNWEVFDAAGLDLDMIRAAADDWRAELGGVEQGWLCWNVNDDWCLVQQKLVQSFGWTPIVGFDPRVGPPKQLTSEAVLVDFNKRLQLPNMFLYIPMEFAFLFCKKLAFWHSDLLLRPSKMQVLSDRFTALENGDIAVTGAWYNPRSLLKPKEARFWELIGCTTEKASRDQFETGCGWWMNFYAHPNCPSDKERQRRKKHYWDHGTGIRYWARHYRKPIELIKESYVEEGHCSQIKNPNYSRVSPNNERRDLSKDITRNFQLAEVCKRLELEAFYS